MYDLHMGNNAGVLWAHTSDLIMRMSNKDECHSPSFYVCRSHGADWLVGHPNSFRVHWQPSGRHPIPIVDGCCGWRGLSELVHALPGNVGKSATRRA